MGVPAKQEEMQELALEPTAAVTTPMDMIAQAISKGVGVEVIDKLMTLQERWQANQGRAAFDAAIAAAKAKIKPIIKSQDVNFGNGKAAYKHETLSDIASHIDPILAENGLSYRFRASQDGPTLSVTCILAHKAGHSEETTLSAPNDTSGSKNPIQAVGSSATYLERYTLKLSLGLAAAKDDDAQAISQKDYPTITKEQVEELRAELKELGRDEKKFCAVGSVDRLEDIPIDQFKAAKQMLANVRKKAK